MQSLKLLIAAGEAAADRREVPAGVLALVEAAEEILVLSPALPSRLDWLTGQQDRTREIADERLQAVLGHLDGAGRQAEGIVGGDDPIVAFEDAIADFGPDHIVIGLRSRDDAGWQEKGLLDQIVERFGLPITVFELDRSSTSP